MKGKLQGNHITNETITSKSRHLYTKLEILTTSINVRKQLNKSNRKIIEFKVNTFLSLLSLNWKFKQGLTLVKLEKVVVLVSNLSTPKLVYARDFLIPIISGFISWSEFGKLAELE